MFLELLVNQHPIHEHALRLKQLAYSVSQLFLIAYQLMDIVTCLSPYCILSNTRVTRRRSAVMIDLIRSTAFETTSFSTA